MAASQIAATPKQSPNTTHEKKPQATLDLNETEFPFDETDIPW